jgi:hypothetical protein
VGRAPFSIIFAKQLRKSTENCQGRVRRIGKWMVYTGIGDGSDHGDWSTRAIGEGGRWSLVRTTGRRYSWEQDKEREKRTFRETERNVGSREVLYLERIFFTLSLMMKAVRSSEMLAHSQNTARHNNPEDIDIHIASP